MTDPCALESFIAWLEKQPADSAYDYGDTANCALCRYAKSLGHKDPRAGGNYFRTAPDDPTIHNILGSGPIVSDRPWTFGAALERARKLAEKP